MTDLAPIILAIDIADVPAELIKHLLTLVLAFAGVFLAHKKMQQGSKEQPVNIAQPLTVQKHDDAVRKSELAKVESSLKSFGERVDSLAEQINAQFAAMTKAGQDRAVAITQNIDEEIGSLQQKIGELAEALHEKINRAMIDNAKQSAEIDSLKASTFRHDAEVRAVQEHIAALLQRRKS